MLAIAVLPASLTYTFGKMTGRLKAGWTLFGVMVFLFVAGLIICDTSERSTPRNFSALHDVAIPFRITVDGHQIDVPVLLRQFGARHGMLLVNRYESIRDYAESLITMGYGYSCLSEPDPSQPEDDNSLFKMLMDWSWSGEGLPPDWLTRHAG